jgi:hypothetical protein
VHASSPSDHDVSASFTVPSTPTDFIAPSKQPTWCESRNHQMRATRKITRCGAVSTIETSLVG